MNDIAQATLDWTEKYGPQTIDHFVLSSILKAGLSAVPVSKHLILAGPTGSGKTSGALVLCAKSKSDYLLVNSGARGTIDYLKGIVSEFASTLSLEGTIKTVIYDDADALSLNTQHMLRGTMEYFEGHTRFIFTTNNPAHLIEAVRSRCIEFDFTVAPEDKTTLMKECVTMCCAILTSEGIKFKEEHVRQLVRRYFPDRRKIIHQIEARSASGTLRIESLKDDRTLDFDYLFDCLQRKQFSEVKRWASCNSQHGHTVLSQLYEVCEKHVTLETWPTFVVVLSDYEERLNRSNNPEIALAALCAELMSQCEFK
jgi:replication factor C small subunit